MSPFIITIYCSPEPETGILRQILIIYRYKILRRTLWCARSINRQRSEQYEIGFYDRKRHTSAAQQRLYTYYYATVVCVIFRLHFSEPSCHSTAAQVVQENTFWGVIGERTAFNDYWTYPIQWQNIVRSGIWTRMQLSQDRVCWSSITFGP